MSWINDKRRLVILWLVILTSGVIGSQGCSMKTRFTNETEAKAYLLENLEKKYDRKFVIVGDEKYHTVGLLDKCQ